MLDLVWLIPALPLAGFLVLLVAGRRLGEPLAGWLATLAAAGSFVATCIVFAGLLARDGDDRQFTQVLFEWIPSGSLRVEAGFFVDQLSITMALFVTGIGTLIHLYSVGYMHGDPKYSKFFVYLNLFLFSMTVLVFGNNLVVTFLGWEGVGACSYFLVAFWHTRQSAATAGKKAFVTNRVGDWGFMIATFLVFWHLGTVTYVELFERAEALAGVTATAIALLLLVAAAGKSAQIPLFVWLPDAMEGPTPVSALIHAATMVTAGVYLLARMNPVVGQSDDALWIIAVIGAVTALFAALAAVAQQDIKRVLAYSTISQLGYMFLAVGSGAYIAAIFHMVTHAFFKANLFLGSGSVIHGMHDEQDMRRMGALAKLMPITAVTFIVGWLAITGVPPLAGFWSKDDILLNAWELSPALWAIGLVTALLTAYYMSRQVFLVFFGERRWDAPLPGPDGEPVAPAHEVHPHESPWTMWVPLVVLAAFSIVAGFVNLPFDQDLLVLEHFLEPVFEDTIRHVDAGTGLKVSLAVIAVIAAVAGILFAALVWLRHRDPRRPARTRRARQRHVRRPDLRPHRRRPRDRGVRGHDGLRRGGRGRRRQRHRDAARPRRSRRPEGPDRAGSAVRHRHRARGGRPRGVPPDEGPDLMSSAVLAAEASATFPILNALIAVPAVGALVVALTPRRRPETVRQVGVLFSAAAAALSIYLLVQFQRGRPGFQFESVQSWIPDLGVSWHVGVDGISLFLVVLTGVIFPVVLIGVDPHHDVKAYTAWMLVLQAASFGAFLALDLFLFFIFFEIVLVPMYMLIAGWGYSERRYAATKFFLFTMAGSAVMLVAIVAVAVLSTGEGAPLTFDVVELAQRQALGVETARLLFLAFAVAFAIKVPIFPVHTWLPDAHTQAPTGGSVILAAVMLKLGTYGFLRFGLYLFPEASVYFAPLMVTLGVIGVIYGAIVATMQRDLKRLVAYSSVAHMGFIILGTFAFTTQGLQGGIIQMVNHGVSTGALFVLVGMIYERRHTREISLLRASRSRRRCWRPCSPW